MDVELSALMKVAIPHWRDRVSPVFDVAGSLLVVELADGRELRREQAALTATDPLKRAKQVSQLGAEVLICGAISWPLEIALSSAGVRVVPFTCGKVEEVLSAFVAGKLTDGTFLMPGCHGWRRQLCGRRGRARPRPQA
jgi:predicted Fe-Mo cluster-binding NifX family protein